MLQSMWKSSLSDKFRNSRRRSDLDIAEVVRRKKQKSSSTFSSGASSQTSNWGLKDFRPSRPIREDDISIQLHIDWLKEESAKRKQDREKIRCLMNSTFPDRRQMILDDMPSVAAVKANYPCLFDEDEVRIGRQSLLLFSHREQSVS